MENLAGYQYFDALPAHTQSYLWPEVFRILQTIPDADSAIRVFDLGCGNGSFAMALADRGYGVVGVDPSEDGIRIARQAYPELDLHIGSAYESLTTRFGQFPVVISLEVIEHVYAPRSFASTLYDLLEDAGTAIISTPYHGYWKNVVLALTGKLDAHFTALWDHGHIKFWSMKTLSQLLSEVGFKQVEFRRVGRIPCLAKSISRFAHFQSSLSNCRPIRPNGPLHMASQGHFSSTGYCYCPIGQEHATMASFV